MKVLTYGKAGVGKTKLCSTAPTPIILSAEAGLLSLSSFDIPVINITTFDDLTESYQWLTESQEAKDFETICLDSITEISEVVLAKELPNHKDPRKAYGEVIAKMNIILKSFRDLSGKHVYMSAKQEVQRDEADGTTAFAPSMVGAKLGQQLPYLFDEVFHMDVSKTQEGVSYRYLRTQPDFNHIAKDRSGKLDEIEKPDLTHIFTKILS